MSIPVTSEINLRFFKRLGGLSLLSLCLTIPSLAHSQVAVTISGQEIYDNNIYLESGQARTPLTEEQLTQYNLSPSALESIDGETNADFIHMVSLAVSGKVPLINEVDTSASARIGTFFFTSRSDESRLALDTNIVASPTEALLPSPFGLTLSSQLSSASQNIAVASGSVARNSLTHDANLGLTLGTFELAPATGLGFNYNLNRHDFLGELNFQDREEEDLVKENGSDYFVNTFGTTLSRQFTERLSAGLNSSIAVYSFTGNDSTDGLTTSNELDRLDWSVGTSASYQATERLNFSGNVGITTTSYIDDPAPITSASADLNQGSVTPAPVLVSSDTEDGSSLVFGGGLTYALSSRTALMARVDQSVGTDIDGTRIISRTFSADISQSLGERYDLGLGGRFMQFDNGNSIASPAERFELSASMRGAITQAIGLSLGLNYADQTGRENADSLLGRNGDYDVLRAFISVDVGLVGESAL
ncbi:MAG: hypothetical protein PHC51_00540 [bacterium]|nr:hypothetical protein [bacterium]